MARSFSNLLIGLCMVCCTTACHWDFDGINVPMPPLFRGPFTPFPPATPVPPAVPWVIGATETLSYSFTDFSEIAVRDSFAILVQPGETFAVELTVDAGLGELVAVDQEGDRLQIGFRDDYYGDIRARTLEGTITLPALTGITLSNSARAMVAGFGGSYLQIDLSGSSLLEVAISAFDFVSETLGGSSQLLLEHIAALPAAHVELSGSSRSRLNIMPGGTLTGFASGSSRISYYGSDLSVYVSTTGTARVNKLGEIR